MELSPNLTNSESTVHTELEVAHRFDPASVYERMLVWREAQTGKPRYENVAELAFNGFLFGYDPDTELFDPVLLADRLGIKVQFRNLGGQLEALLFADSPFTISVDPRLKDRQLPLVRPRTNVAALQALVIADRILHEIGHTFFFRWAANNPDCKPKRYHPPTRTMLERPPEEKFCDLFAFSTLWYALPQRQRRKVQAIYRSQLRDWRDRDESEVVIPYLEKFLEQ